MEYVIVAFPTDRLVYVDGEKDGRTNTVLKVDAGTHDFDLGPVENYRPGTRKVTLSGTTSLEPRVIAFHRLDDE